MTLTAQLRQQQEQLAQGAAGQNVNIPIPMDQLRGMANEMNSILSNLLVSALSSPPVDNLSDLVSALSSPLLTICPISW